MPSSAISGVGTVFQRAAVAIAEINAITGPSMVRDTIDVTSLDSTGGYREFITGFRDGGTLTLNMNFTRDGYEVLRIDFVTDATVTYTIVLADASATTISFEGLVTEMPLSIPTDDKITIDVTIKVTGVVTLTS